MWAARLNSGPGQRWQRGQASRDSRSDPGRRFECSSLGPCSRRAHLENRGGGGAFETERGSSDDLDASGNV